MVWYTWWWRGTVDDKAILSQGDGHVLKQARVMVNLPEHLELLPWTT